MVRRRTLAVVLILLGALGNGGCCWRWRCCGHRFCKPACRPIPVCCEEVNCCSSPAPQLVPFPAQPEVGPHR